MQNWILVRSLLISLEVLSNVIQTSDGLQPRYKGFTFIVFCIECHLEFVS
jgi:hypothetical protein